MEPLLAGVRAWQGFEFGDKEHDSFPLVRDRFLKTTTCAALLAVAYFVTGWLGLMLPAVGSHITLLWLPTGIAVGSLLRWGNGCWPGVALGAFAVNVATGTFWSASLGIAAGNTLGPLLAAWALRRMGLHAAFDRKRDILLLAAGAVLGMLVSATLGVATLSLAGILHDGRIAAWLVWWAGDATGVIAAAPLVLACTRREWRSILVRRAEFLTWALGTSLAAWAVFVLNQGLHGEPWAVAFLPLPLVAWAALRFGSTGTSLALIVLSAGAAFATATGRGPFHRADPIESIVGLWLFMATSAVLGWLITALHFARVRATGIQTLFEQALSEVSFGIIFTDLDRRITYANAGFTRLTGYSEADLLGKSCAILQGPGTDPAMVEKLKSAVHGDGVFDGEILNYRKDGTPFWNALMISPVRDEVGEMTGFLGVQRDITKREAASEALRESEERFRRLIEHAPEAIQLLDMATGRFVLISLATEKMFKRAAAELYRMGPMDLSPPVQPDGRPSVEKGRDLLDRAMAGETPVFEWTHRDAAGRDFPCEVRLLRMEIGGRAVVRGSITDITERKAAEGRLRESEARYRMLFEANPHPMWVYDLGTLRFLAVNVAAITHYGYRQEEFLAMTIRDIRPPEDVPALLANVAATVAGPDHAGVWRHCKRDGSLLEVEISSHEIEFDGRRARVVLANDVTEQQRAKIEREQLNRKMQETQKLESLGVLAGGIAHDFNNILTAVLGNASLALNDVQPGSPVHECLDQINQAALRAADLCRQMLAYSGRGRFVVRRLDLGQLIAETTQMLQISISKKAVLRFRPAPSLPPVEVDPTQMRQVIMNLVINASDAIGEKGGVIHVSTGVLRVDAAYLRAANIARELPEGDYVFLEVSDDGCGMSPETQAKIFDPFFTTKFTGRGLGLAAVLGIVRGHKGALKVYSEPGRGSIFKLLFPVAAGPTDAAMDAPVIATGWRGEGTVLVVDDEPSVRTTVAQMLIVMGMQSMFAADGREGVKIFSADPGRFALVLLDLTMPQMDGAEAFAELRKLRPGVPVVLMSGFNEQEALVRFAGKGIASFIQKPFTLDSLRAVIRNVLG